MLRIYKYNSNYVKLFQSEKDKLSVALNNICIIEHIGSTAIPGVDGKGVIDIMLVFNNESDIKDAIKSLCAAGYHKSPDNIDRRGRIFMSSAGESESKEGDYHLHLLTKNNDDYHQAILFRDYLINHEDARQSYNTLKYELQNTVNGDRKKYTKLKSDFIKNVIALAENEKSQDYNER